MWCALFVALLSAPPFVTPPKAQDRVGRLIVEGNADTPDYVILGTVDLWSGQILDRSKVGAAQKRLDKLGLFRTATIELVPNLLDDTYKDILIRVEERSWVWLTFATEDMVFGVFTLNTHLLQNTADRVRAKFRGPVP